jgi:hypothetical protein
MAKRKKPTTHEHCRTCIHDREYPEEVITPPYPAFYCGLVSDQPVPGPVFHQGDLPDAIRAWIWSGEVSFSPVGIVDGRVTAPCPGYMGDP